MIETTVEHRENTRREPPDIPLLGRSELLCMARGFACVFWGLLVTLILFFANAFFEIFDIVRIPAYVIGSAIVARGLFVLHGAGGAGRAWIRRTRILLFLVMLQIYFAPFIVWWRATPYMSLLLLNSLCLVLTGILSLFCVNLLVAEGLRLACATSSRLNPRLSAAVVFLFMIIPFFVVVGLPVVWTVSGQTSFYFEMRSMVNRVPAWFYTIVALPCALTLAAAWQAKDRCYREFMAGG